MAGLRSPGEVNPTLPDFCCSLLVVGSSTFSICLWCLGNSFVCKKQTWKLQLQELKLLDLIKSKRQALRSPEKKKRQSTDGNNMFHSPTLRPKLDKMAWCPMPFSIFFWSGGGLNISTVLFNWPYLRLKPLQSNLAKKQPEPAKPRVQ